MDAEQAERIAQALERIARILELFTDCRIAGGTHSVCDLLTAVESKSHQVN